jgi:hypothetical protein
MYFFNKSVRKLYSSVVGGGNTTFIGCQPPLNLIEEKDSRQAVLVLFSCPDTSLVL